MPILPASPCTPPPCPSPPRPAPQDGDPYEFASPVDILGPLAKAQCQVDDDPPKGFWESLEDKKWGLRKVGRWRLGGIVRRRVHRRLEEWTKACGYCSLLLAQVVSTREGAAGAVRKVSEKPWSPARSSPAHNPPMACSTHPSHCMPPALQAALEKVKELARTPRLAAGDYGDLVRVLKKILQKDSIIPVAAAAAEVAAVLALGLRDAFSGHAKVRGWESCWQAAW